MLLYIINPLQHIYHLHNELLDVEEDDTEYKETNCRAIEKRIEAHSLSMMFILAKKKVITFLSLVLYHFIMFEEDESLMMRMPHVKGFH